VARCAGASRDLFCAATGIGQRRPADWPQQCSGSVCPRRLRTTGDPPGLQVGCRVHRIARVRPPSDPVDIHTGRFRCPRPRSCGAPPSTLSIFLERRAPGGDGRDVRRWSSWAPPSPQRSPGKVAFPGPLRSVVWATRTSAVARPPTSTAGRTRPSHDPSLSFPPRFTPQPPGAATDDSHRGGVLKCSCHATGYSAPKNNVIVPRNIDDGPAPRTSAGFANIPGPVPLPEAALADGDKPGPTALIRDNQTFSVRCPWGPATLLRRALEPDWNATGGYEALAGRPSRRKAPTGSNRDRGRPPATSPPTLRTLRNPSSHRSTAALGGA